MAYIGQSLTEGTRRAYNYTATASQTTFNAVYTVGAVDVYQNGVLLTPDDYTASTGTTVVLGTGAAANDEITIICHNTFSVADTVSASQGGTFNQPVTIDGDGAAVLTVDRATSDGTIIDVQKGGTTVGSIGTLTGDMYLGTGDTGLYFLDSSDAIIPANPSSPSVSNGIVNLGQPSYRFKDLYLSGGVYLGGTGAANKLDDYEEGTWTPTASFSTTNATLSNVSGRYVKVGQLVTVTFYVAFSANGSGSSAKITGLPFVNNQDYALVTLVVYNGAADRQYAGYVNSNNDKINITDSGNTSSTLLSASDFTNSSEIGCTFSYHTNS